MNTPTSPSFSPSFSGLARQLVDRLSSRLAQEKQQLVLFLIELADFDSKKLALELGYPSTLGCLVGELGLTESSACRRIAAARLLARFPQIAPLLVSSRLTLSGLVVLKEVLDDSNVDQVLERAAGLGEPDLRQLVMRIRFGAAAPSTGVEVSPLQVALATGTAAAPAADAVATSCRSSASTEPSPAAPIEELEAMTLWVGRQFRQEFAAVRALLSHVVPSGKKEEVFLHLLRAQRKVLERRRYGSPKRKRATAAQVGTSIDAHAPGPEGVPSAAADASTAVATREAAKREAAKREAPKREAPKREDAAEWVAKREAPKRGQVLSATGDVNEGEANADRENIPTEVRHEVFERDGGCCTYVGEAGRRCGSTLQIEYQHIVPAARGGRATVENLTLHCHPHNQLQAEKDFGVEHVRRKQALSALTRLGYRRGEAERAVRVAVGQLPRPAALDTLVRAGLRLLVG